MDMAYRGFKISRRKIEYMVLKVEHAGKDVRLLGEKLKRIDTFKCLGSHVSLDEALDEEISHRIETLVRPAIMSGAEMWPIKKDQERRLDVAEKRMLRWMCGAGRLCLGFNRPLSGGTELLAVIPCASLIRDTILPIQLSHVAAF
ncbi:uncharacterized protein LOC134765515 [Penaeus indicus]|uniref:uncharacterized protein LOC134765515 n=1 Tax=Penaeus indicus TaxID=29960 RepID=UPI00300CD847